MHIFIVIENFIPSLKYLKNIHDLWESLLHIYFEKALNWLHW